MAMIRPVSDFCRMCHKLLNREVLFLLRLRWLRLILVLCLMAQEGSSGWQPVLVPGSWDQAIEAAGSETPPGYAWFRTWVKPHPSFFTPHERNLFEESVTITIRDLAGAHELFVNGLKIGAGGQMPPDFKSGAGVLHRHKVPAGTLRKGEWNEIAIRVYNPDPPGGFLGEAPFIMDYFMESVLEGVWEFRWGDDPLWAGAARTEKPAVSAFDQFRESSRVLGEAAGFVAGPKLSPHDSFQQMQTVEDLKVELLLHEPLVAQPSHFSFDERGRLWVTQYRQYPYPAGLDMISRDKYYRAHYDRMPPPPPGHDAGRDLISIHEDTNGDGRFDKHTVFLEGLNMANAALPGRGGVWVMHTPYLLFYPDNDFDDVPDGPPEVRLQGFGLEDTHSVANGLVWGMDGWLYGAQGSTTSSRVTRPGIDPPDSPGVYFEGCMVWRYHPETRAYEIFAEGSGNIFGLEVDAQGRLFSGHNGGETRGWHYVQGGYYLKQGVDPGKFGPPRNPYAFGELPMMRSETRAARFTHLFAVGEGTALPSRYAGMLFALDPLHNVVIAAERRPVGATFSTSDEGPALSSSDVAFRPVHIANAPDGSLFIADFYNYYIAHGQHYQSMIDPDTGRIYRLRGSENALEPDINLEGKTTGQLIALLSHPNKWHRHMAVRLLGERKDQAATPPLKALLSRETGLAALNAFWALDQSGALDEETALEALAHSCPAVRMWAVRWAGDNWGTHPGLGLPGIETGTGAVPSQFFEALLEQARHEPDAEVRSQMAASARRFPAQQGLALVGRLFEHEIDLHDPYIPLLCWWVLESHSTAYREEVLAVFHDRSLWDRSLVFEHILPRVMRRFALEGRRQDLLACAQLLRTAPSSRHAARLMNGFEEAYRGRAMANLPEELVEAMNATGQLPLIVRVRLGEGAALGEALKIIQDPKAGMDDRLLYTRALGELREQIGLPVLLRMAEEDQPVPLRRAALASLSGYEDEKIGAELLELLGGLPKELRHAAFAVLAARPQWSRMLLAQIEAGQIQPTDLPRDVVDRMRSHRDEALSGLVLHWFPLVTSAETGALNEQIKEVQAVLRRGAGSPYAGEAIYMDRCAACHKLFHKGGNLGPDLTAYQRDNIETMLLSIIHPNAEIREGYDYYLIETHDERSLSGFLVQRDPQVTVLRGMEGEDMILRREEIKEIRPLGRSFMPEGLLDELDEQQLRDLFAYLRISQPITR